MFLSPKLGLTFGAVALGLLALPAAQAQTTPAFYSGTFLQDDSHSKTYSFDIVSPGMVTLYTTSYGGGLNVDGSTTAAGGFDPVINLFDAKGAYITYDDDASPFGKTDPKTDAAMDAGIQANGDMQMHLDPGTYQVVVTEWNSYPLQADNTDPSVTYGLSDGFTRDGQGNFTGDYFGNPDGSQAGMSFIDANHTKRSNYFNLNITSEFPPVTAAVPEASTTISFGLLMALGLGGAGVAARKKARASAA